MAAQYATFAMSHRNTQGVLDLLYTAQDEEFGILASCINTARGMLSTTRASDQLIQLALRLDSLLDRPWYRGRYTIPELVAAFLAKIMAVFPVVVVDDTIVNPDILGWHSRGNWEGDFNPSSQMVNLNGWVRISKPPIELRCDSLNF